MWGFFLVSTGLITLAVLYMLLVLPAKGVPLQVTAVVGVAWFTTLLVCCIVPIDVYSTLASKNPIAVEVLWDLAYWSTQLLTWALIPLYMGYVDAGEFTWAGKMQASVKTNGLFISIMVTVGTIGIAAAVVSGKLTLTTLPSLGIQLSNMFGLVCVLALLGFGLVAVPRRAWKRSFPELQLRHQLFRLGRLAEERAEAQQLLAECLRKLNSTKQALGNSEAQAHARINGMLAFVSTFVGDGVQPAAQVGTVQQGIEYADELPKLHKEIKRDVSWVGAVSAQADMTIRKACYLTKVVKASKRDAEVVEAIQADAEGPWWARAWWHFDVFVRPWLLRGVAVAAAALSAVVLWGEVAVGVSPKLSPLSHLVATFDNQFVAQLLVMLPLIYVLVATYTAFFAVDIGSLYILLPHSSSSLSLLFNGTLMARFAPALCYNYLHVLGMDRPTGAGYSTVFAQRMGMGRQGDVAIPFLGTPFNRWAPVLILLIVWLTFVNVFGKVYKWLTSYIPFVPQAYDEDDGDENSESSRFVAEGQRIVNRAMQEQAQGHAISADFMNLARYSPSPAQHHAHISRNGSRGSLASSKSNSIGGQSTGQAPLLP